MNFGVIGALSGLLGVIAGAFGAHALKARLAPDLLQAFETGARYQLIHALALMIVALAIERTPRRTLRTSGWLFVIGTVLFAGSLYALALTGVREFGMITPLGGIVLLAAWITIAFGLRRNTSG
jgi:uncharacterized membrane protein YgdD (TMEM256/DUF423 family)